MKTYIPYSLILAAAASGLAFGAETAYTTPVGYVTLGDSTIGQPSIKPNTDVFASIPLEQAPIFNGLVGSVSGNQITISGTPNLGTLTNPVNPSLVKITSGTGSGIMALITANTTDTVTVTVQPGDSLASVAAGNKISILPAWTIKKLLGTTLPAGTQVIAFTGVTEGVNLGADLIFEFDGADWVDVITSDFANDVVLFQTESFIIRNQAATPITSLVVSGQVPASSHRVVVTNTATSGQDNLISYSGAVGETIGTSGLTAIAGAGDQVLVFDNNASGVNKGASQIIEYDGADWVDVITSDIVTTTFKLKAGEGYIIRRAPSSALTDVIWTDVPDYVSSL